MNNLVKGNMPDVTPPQIIAMIVAGIPILAELLRAFGVYDLSVEQQDALSNAVTWAGVLAGALIGGDALLRVGRNLRKGQVEAALVSEPGINPDSDAVANSVLVRKKLAGTGTTYQTAPPPEINPATGLPSRPTGFEETPPPA